MNYCPGCLKEGRENFCPRCRKNLFDGQNISRILLFSRPEYNQAKISSLETRLSISGIQTKISLALRDKKLEMTERGGQYILKPIPTGVFQNLNMVPINEHLTMQIARQVFGINVAENALVQFAEGEPAYLVRRFDLQKDGTKLLQEDFAQIANRSADSHGENYKYDLSYEEIGTLIRKHVAAYPVEMEKFFHLVVFNYFVHNGDAHLKNFSLFRNEQFGDYTLTPAYDLLNTRLHIPQESRTALDLFKGDFQTPSFQANGFYAFDDFFELAQRLGLKEKRFRKILNRFIHCEEKVFSLIDRSQLSTNCKKKYREQVQESVKALSFSQSGLLP